MDNIKVVLIDDHVLLRNALASLISAQGYIVHFQCDNGSQLINKLDKEDLPDIILMDINMPEMDGFETTLWLRKNFPLINVLALSMCDDENAIIHMLRNGAKGYILKECAPSELKKAIDAIVTKGFYYSETVTGKLVHSVHEMDETGYDYNKPLFKLNDREMMFLKLACTEMTYREIADRMYLSPRTIDGYRDNLFEKLNVKSRIGLMLFGLKNGLIRSN